MAAIFKSESRLTWRPIRGLPNDCHVTEKGANFLLNTEKSRNNQAKVPNRTPFFTCIFEPPIKKSSQKLTMNKHSHKKKKKLLCTYNDAEYIDNLLLQCWLITPTLGKLSSLPLASHNRLTLSWKHSRTSLHIFGSLLIVRLPLKHALSRV